MDEEKRFLSGATALAVAGIAAVAVVTVIIVMALLGGSRAGEGDGTGWKSPAMAFTDGTEMTGSAVTDSMKSFEGFEVGFIVTTKDGVTAVYNYDGNGFLPTYDRNIATTSAGYINPNGVFYITAEPDAGGRVRQVVITQK